MAPTRKFQASVKEMLLRKQAQNKAELQDEEEDNETIILPNFLREHTNIRAVFDDQGHPKDAVYPCTELARTFYRENSNLNGITNSYLQKHGDPKRTIGSYTNSMIRAVTSLPERRYQEPFSRFRFVNADQQAMGLNLLINSGIKYNRDVVDFDKFNNEIRLKLVTVSMAQNNELHSDAKAFIEERQRKLNIKSYPPITASDYKYNVERKYYERNNLVQIIFIRDTNVQQLEHISNFKSYLNDQMINDDIPAKYYSEYAKLILKTVQNNPDHFVRFPGLRVAPKFNLICNMMTDQQLKEAAQSLNLFYKLTNVRDIRKHIKNRPPRQEFYEMFRDRSCWDRRMPPFENLVYISQKDDQPGPSISTLQSKCIERFEKNNENINPCVQSLEDDSNGSSMVTIVHNRESSLDQPRHLDLPPSYLQPILIHGDEFELVKILASDRVFVRVMKQQLKEAYGKNFEDLWKTNKKQILGQAILDYLENKIEDLKELVANIQTENRDAANNLIEKIRATAGAASSISHCNTEASAQQNTTGRSHRNSESLRENDSNPCEAATPNVSSRNDNITSTPKSANRSISSRRITSHFASLHLKDQTATRLTQLSTPDLIEQKDSSSEALKDNENQMESHQRSNASKESSFKDVTGQDDDMEIDPQEVEIVGSFSSPKLLTVFKHEPMSQKPFVEDSDVMCMGTMIEDVIEISESQDQDESLIKTLEDHSPQNPFMRLIAEGTQPDETEAPKTTNMSDDSLMKLKEFESVTVQQRDEDRQFRKKKPLQESPLNSPPSHVTKRKAANRSGRQRKKTKSPVGIDYIDVEDSPTTDTSGNSSIEVRDVLYEDYSVFLSSQLNDVELMQRSENVQSQNPFTFAKEPSVSSGNSAEKSCYYGSITRVLFEKNKSFVLHMNFPQFNMYNVVVVDEAVKSVLQLNDVKFNSLMQLLNMVDRYEFLGNVVCKRPTSESYHQFVYKQLDQFFSTQNNFKTFSLVVYDEINNQVNAEKISTSTSKVDVTSAIESSTLSRIRSLRPRR